MLKANLACGDPATIEADGPDSEKAVARLVNLVREFKEKDLKPPMKLARESLKTWRNANSGNVCGARNTKVEQSLLSVFLGETMSAHDWRDGIGDLCVADYLAEFNEVHRVRYSTPVLDLSRLFPWSICGCAGFNRLRFARKVPPMYTFKCGEVEKQYDGF